MAVEEFSPIRKWFTELPWRAKPRVPLERASKTILETGVKSDVTFCLWPSIEKTNSARAMDNHKSGLILSSIVINILTQMLLQK